MLEASIRNLQSDISLLQTYIGQRQKASFHDVERMVESLTIHLFKALGIANLKNVNEFRSNAIAIDLSDENKRVAVQVTTNASVSKLRKTVENFEKVGQNGRSLRASYDKLYIFGFCKWASNVNLPSYCELVTPVVLVSRLVDRGDVDVVDDVIHAVRQHSSYKSLHPWNDRDSLEIILDVLNRNAIKHRMSCEGNVKSMTGALDEVSELIGKGTLNKKEKSKAISDFTDVRMKQFLRTTMHNIGRILSIVYSNTRGDVTEIEYQAMLEIDEIKKMIARDASGIAGDYGLSVKIDVM